MAGLARGDDEPRGVRIGEVIDATIARAVRAGEGMIGIVIGAASRSSV